MFAVVSDKNEVIAVATTEYSASTLLEEGQTVVRADTVCPPHMLDAIHEGSEGLCDWIYWHRPAGM
jgi:hypothetical protein